MKKNLNQDLVVIFTEKSSGIISRITHETAMRLEGAIIVKGRVLSLIYRFPALFRILHPNSAGKNMTFIFNTYTWFNQDLCDKFNAKSIGVMTHLDNSSITKQRKWKEVCDRADGLICISTFTYKQVINEKHNLDSTVLISPYGLSHDIYRPKVNILVVGNNRLDNRKNQDFVESVMQDPKLNIDIQFKFIGKNWINGIEPSDYSDLREYYHWSDALFVPSTLEGGHTPTIEALAMGIPVITSATGWAAYDVEAIIYANSDIDSAVMTLNNFASSLLTHRQLLSERVSEFTWENWIRNMQYMISEIHKN